MADAPARDALTSPRAVAVYLGVVATTAAFHRFGWSPAYLACALLLLPWLSEHGVAEDVPTRPAWWVPHAASAAVLALLAWTAHAVEAVEGPWATSALVLAVPLAPVLVPAYGLLGTPALGTPMPHLAAAVAILTPIYGFALHQLRLRDWHRRQRRVRVARMRIRAAIRTGTAEVRTGEEPSAAEPNGDGLGEVG